MQRPHRAPGEQPGETTGQQHRKHTQGNEYRDPAVIDQYRVRPGPERNHRLFFRVLDGAHPVVHVADGHIPSAQRQAWQFDAPEDHQSSTLGVTDRQHECGFTVPSGGLHRIGQHVETPIELPGVVAHQGNTGDNADQGDHQAGGEEGRHRDPGTQGQRAFHGSSRIT
ncbi:Uncharacterised protein [Mycobacteroides abscessus subsp. abscessus]|nr:Uncharacterised protein [Mycobacteroides abscessus subsp. abscessus]